MSLCYPTYETSPPSGEYLVVLKGVILRSIGSGCATNSAAAFERDLNENSDDYLERGADNVIREADGTCWVYAPNGISCVPSSWGPWAGVWCRLPGLWVLADEIELDEPRYFV